MCNQSAGACIDDVVVAAKADEAEFLGPCFPAPTCCWISSGQLCFRHLTKRPATGWSVRTWLWRE